MLSAPLEEIKEEEELLRNSMTKSEAEGEKEGETKEIKKELTPEEMFEKEKNEKIQAIVKMEYLLFIAKTFRVIIFVLVILLAMLSSFYKCNIWGAMVLFCAAIFSFSSVMFRNVKWFTLAMAVLLLVQYSSVLVNMSYETRTSIFPDPFQDVLKDRPLPVPLYRHFGSPITEDQIVPDQGAIIPVPQRWAFFLGFIISRSRFNNLWVDFIALVLMNYFFIYFYSASYELDMSLNTKEAVSRTIDAVNDEVGDTLKKSFIESMSDKEENKEDLHKSLDEIVSQSKKNTNYYEAQKYIDKVKSKMVLVRFYDGLSTAI